MIAISKISNKRLIKGHRYELSNLWNSGKNQRWLEGKLEISDFGRYSVSGFTDVDGNPLPAINWTSNKPKVVRNYLKFEELKEGELLVCASDHYKTMIKGSMYKIQKLETVKYQVKNWRGELTTIQDKFIRFEGVRKLKFNPWSFRKLTSEEVRDISLVSLLHNQEPEIVKTNSLRKIDMVLNKEKALMEILAKTILDTNRHHLSIIDWTCEKTGEKLRVNPGDFKDLLDMKLSDILTKIEK